MEWRTRDLEVRKLIVRREGIFFRSLPRYFQPLHLYQRDEEEVEGVGMVEEQFVNVETLRNARDIGQAEHDALLVSFVELIHCGFGLLDLVMNLVVRWSDALKRSKLLNQLEGDSTL